MKAFSCILIVTLFIVVKGQNSTSSYDPAELLTRILQPNATIQARQRGYGFIEFEDHQNTHLTRLEEDQPPHHFQHQNYAPYYTYNNDQNPIYYNPNDLIGNGQVTFQEDSKIEGNKKRKRRRKPKNGIPLPAYGNHYPGYPYGEPIRPPRRHPRPSLASAALSSVIEALTSIATYDDYQCVPRLLCEAAGGGALSSNGLLQSIAGIQPLLALLSTYNGISSSPLFVFGRAVFLGMTSKGNTGTCRYAYSQCPTDPEDLIFYLNNYNGGFFRFFNAPQTQPQNIEQFYNHLGQYQGPYDPNPQYYQQNNYNNNNRPSLYNKNQGSYAYNYNYNSNPIRFQDDNKIQKRIQIRPNYQDLIEDSFEDSDDYRSGWLFPDENNDNYYNVRGSQTMRFPETYNQNDKYRKGKVINYPEHVYNSQTYNDRPHTFSNRYESTTYSYNNGQKYNNYQSSPNYNNYNNNYNKYPNDYTNNNQGIKYYNYNQRPIDYQNYNSNNDYSYQRPNNYQNYNNENANAVKIYYNPIPNNNNNYNQNNQNYYNNQQNMYSNNQKFPQSTVFNNEEYVYDHKHNFYVKKPINNNNQNNNYNQNSYYYAILNYAATHQNA